MHKIKNKFNIVIPMAGESSRFNYQFKPFLKLDNRTFIEHMISSFDNINVDSYNFIITEQQEKQHNVIKRLKEKIFPDIADKINVIQISKKTSGPYQTIITGLEQIGTLKDVIFCDCDHFVDVLPIVDVLNANPDCEICVPVWNISYEEQQNWGKIVLNNEDQSILQVCEKETLQFENGKTIYGIIGCYYFNCTDILIKDYNYKHFSDFMKNHRLRHSVNIAFIQNAFFFGTPAMAQESIKLRRRWATVICDVDGVLIEHKNHSTDLIKDNIPIKECVRKLKKWRSENKKIVLATARPKSTKKAFKLLLKNLGIIYDDLIMSLNAGPRYLINDIKPSNPFVKQSISINVPRDSGIDYLELLESNNYNIDVVHKLKGNSFSQVYLLQQGSQLFVRKYIKKNESCDVHYFKLKRQCDDLRRYKLFNPSMVPKVLQEKDSDYDYYFDMEYLSGYKQLDEFNIDIQNKIINRVIKNLHNSVYCYSKQNKSTKFIEEFFNTKINPKLDLFEKDCQHMNQLINSEKVTINGRSIFGLREVLNRLNLFEFNTEKLSPIHGDLTLENILYNIEHDDFKLIDMEGSSYVDTCYLDLGKIFQSVVSKYKEWNTCDKLIFTNDKNCINCESRYFTCNPEDYRDICENYCLVSGNTDWENVFSKGIFYMAMYFIRFVPFRKQISNDHAIFAILMAINWLNYLYERKNYEN